MVERLTKSALLPLMNTTDPAARSSSSYWQLVLVDWVSTLRLRILLFSMIVIGMSVVFTPSLQPNIVWIGIHKPICRLWIVPIVSVKRSKFMFSVWWQRCGVPPQLCWEARVNHLSSELGWRAYAWKGSPEAASWSACYSARADTGTKGYIPSFTSCRIPFWSIVS